MRVLFCASEIVPLAKTGGLADVAGALPAALARRGVDVRLAMPRYRGVDLPGGTALGTLTVPLGGETVEGTVLDGALPGSGVPIWLVEQPELFDRGGLYGEGGQDYPDNLTRFTFFCRAVARWLARGTWQPDVIHSHDWQTALLPAIIRTEGAPRAASVFTIHNLAYQGLFPAEQFALTGLPPAAFAMQGLEFWGQVSLLKGGLVFADLLTTVSATYAREIQSEEFGAGLEGVLRDRADDLVGILNGVDYEVWDPSVDALLPARYSADDMDGKPICKRALQRAFGLPEDARVPVVGMVTRLADQKGLDLVVEIMEELLDAGVQFVLLGTGDPRYHQVFDELQARRRHHVGVRLGFDNALAHLIEAGADIFLMPSRYEPSGLNQLYSLRYGTVPVVRRTGGLADSVVDATPQALAAGRANGFVFAPYEPQALLGAVRRALAAYRHPDTWRALQQAGMRADFSWGRAAGQYAALYERALAKAGAPR